MTIADLLESLKGEPLNTKLFVSSDPEGNAISPMHEVAWSEDEIGKKILVVWPA